MNNWMEYFKEFSELNKNLQESLKLENEIENDKLKIEDDIKNTTIRAIDSLSKLLESITINDEKQIPGCEPVFEQTFDESEKLRIKGKIFNLINKL